MFSLPDLETFLKSKSVAFKETQFATDEYGNCYVDDEVYIEEIITRSKMFPTEHVLLCDMEHGKCHSNVSSIYNSDEWENGDKIVTGYALNRSDEWFPHSWIVNVNGQIVETFSIVFKAYVGFELNNQELDDFVGYWYCTNLKPCSKQYPNWIDIAKV